MNQQAFRNLISGRSKGFVPAFLRLLLKAASLPYTLVVAIRNLMYSNGWFRVHRADAVVISVGNITVGGTGKTPLVIWLCDFLRQKKLRCGILTRGYKLGKSKLYDETAILTRGCPDAKVVVNPDRLGGAAEAVRRFNAQVLVIDDGFQHRRLHRDLDIVTIDGLQPFGFGKVLPAGLLREPLSGLRRAHALVITRCDQAADANVADIEQKLKMLNPDAVTARTMHKVVNVGAVGRKEMSLEELKGKNVFAFCGIGNPAAFLRTVQSLDLNLVGHRLYNDHHHYTERCLMDIFEEARYLQAEVILTTQKDWTKTALPTPADDSILFAYLAVELQFQAGQDQVKRLIEDTLADRISTS